MHLIRNYLRRLLFSFVFLVLILSFLSIAVLASLSIDGGLTRKFTVRPGDTISGTITLRNRGVTPLTIKLYLTDYLYYADGRNLYQEPGSHLHSNANWIKINPDRITIPPEEESSVNYVIKVPRKYAGKRPGLEFEGTYWSLLIAEPLPEETPFKEGVIKKERPEKTLMIKTVIRYGIQLITQIGNSGSYKLKVTDRKLIKKENSQYYFQLDLKNTGSRWLIPEVSIKLYDLTGNLIKIISGGSLRIYPATSVRYRMKLNKILSGEYLALVIINNGDGHIWQAEYQLKLD